MIGHDEMGKVKNSGYVTGRESITVGVEQLRKGNLKFSERKIYFPIFV